MTFQVGRQDRKANDEQDRPLTSCPVIYDGHIAILLLEEMTHKVSCAAPRLNPLIARFVEKAPCSPFIKRKQSVLSSSPCILGEAPVTENKHKCFGGCRVSASQTDAMLGLWQHHSLASSGETEQKMPF